MLTQKKAPSPSGVYTILKCYGKNRLVKPMQEEKRRIIKEKAGELAHIDAHHLSQDMISGDKKKYYLVCVIDSCTRVAWAEVNEDLIEGTFFESIDKFRDELFQYLLYYNKLRPHQAIGGQTPEAFAKLWRE